MRVFNLYHSSDLKKTWQEGNYTSIGSSRTTRTIFNLNLKKKKKHGKKMIQFMTKSVILL